MPHPLAGVRYVTTFASAGAGQALLTRQVGRLYGARLVGYTGPARAVLYDHSRYPQRPIAVLVAHSQPDDYPRQPVTLPLEQGLYVSFSVTAGEAALTALWERAGGREEGSS